MKMTRKLIPALVMLLVSAIMLSTASYAWFASNSTVGMSDMRVRVKANTRFLQISESEDTGFGTALNYQAEALAERELITASFSKEDSSLVLSWFTGTSNDFASSGAPGTIPMEDMGKLDSTYTLHKTVYVKMSNNSTAGLSDLKFDMTAGNAPSVLDASDSTTPTNELAEAIRILVVARGDADAVTGAGLWDYVEGAKYLKAEDGTLVENGSILSAIALNTTYKLDVYIYYDGNDAQAFTNNTDGLEELLIGFNLTAATAG